jgi:hypothetical protein
MKKLPLTAATLIVSPRLPLLIIHCPQCRKSFKALGPALRAAPLR